MYITTWVKHFIFDAIASLWYQMSSNVVVVGWSEKIMIILKLARQHSLYWGREKLVTICVLWGPAAFAVVGHNSNVYYADHYLCHAWRAFMPKAKKCMHIRGCRRRRRRRRPTRAWAKIRERWKFHNCPRQNICPKEQMVLGGFFYHAFG